MPVPLALCVLAASSPAPPDGFYVRRGYEVRVVIRDLSDARFLEFDDRGTLYVSRPQRGEIAAFRAAGEGFERLGAFVTGKRSCHGMHFHDGWLWFTTSGGVHRARDTDADGKADEVVDVVTGLPSGGHWWRPVFVTPEGFFTSIGDSGNISDETGTDRQKIWRYAPDGESRVLFASGLRNTEKYRFRPGTAELWGFDHGSDWFGAPIGDSEGNQPITDLNPPEELNLYVKDGFYGHPFVVGTRLPRYEYRDRRDIHELASRTTPPEWSLPAHWACNGWTFIDPARNTGPGALPKEVEGDIFVAAHGSWNSSRPVGYCVARVLFDKDPASDRAGRPYGVEKIVGCIDSSGRVRARPVDCVQAPDGSVLFSSDDPGRVYRITRAE
jgi:glucose/arabinose dehydrogenase